MLKLLIIFFFFLQDIKMSGKNINFNEKKNQKKYLLQKQNNIYY